MNKALPEKVALRIPPAQNPYPLLCNKITSTAAFYKITLPNLIKEASTDLIKFLPRIFKRKFNFPMQLR